MMKSLFASVVLLGVLVVLLLAMDIQEGRIDSVNGNSEGKALEIDLNRTACAQCATPIQTLEYSAQVVNTKGTTYFFDDIGCLCLWLNAHPDIDIKHIWVYTQDTKRYILAKDAWFSRIESSPIGYGFAAYEVRLYARAAYYFEEIFRFAIHGETRLNPAVNKLLVENKI
jgi:hypothetical protein